MKQTAPKRFPKQGGGHKPRNSGMFSNSGNRQKMDNQVKPSNGQQPAKRAHVRMATDQPRKKNLSS